MSHGVQVAIFAAACPAVLALLPACAIQDTGYKDPFIPFANGGFLADATACQGSCAALIGCQAFTYYAESKGCWLQGLSGTLPPTEAIPGAVSGPKICLQQAASGADEDPDVAGAATELASSTSSAPVAAVVPIEPTTAQNISDPSAPTSPPIGWTAGSNASFNGSQRTSDINANSHDGIGFPWGIVCAIGLAAVASFVAANYCGNEGRKGTRSASFEERSPRWEAPPRTPMAEVSRTGTGSFLPREVPGPIVPLPALPMPAYTSHGGGLGPRGLAVPQPTFYNYQMMTASLAAPLEHAGYAPVLPH